ncbi:hypothetical protein MKX08_002896 [Trichoderma sp. CBMAI-0020]|nr:hypothetical protein MKX08_002896 [Trichoderma sp. CBMAI-0020]
MDREITVDMESSNAIDSGGTKENFACIFMLSSILFLSGLDNEKVAYWNKRFCVFIPIEKHAGIVAAPLDQ